MSISSKYILRQDGSVCSAFSPLSDASDIRELVVDQNWDELLAKREHRIIDSVKLSDKSHVARNIDDVTWRMELFPLEGNEKDAPAFICSVNSLNASNIDTKQNEINSLRTIIDAMPFGVAVIRRDKRVYIMNQAALDLAGYSSMEEFEALHRPCQDTFCPAPKGKCPVWDIGQLFDKTERPFLMRDGTKIQVLKSAVPVNIEGEKMMLEGIIDLRKQKDLELLAYSDPLTGTLNRKGLREKFKVLSTLAKVGESNYTVMMFDLNDFKAINDSYGHFAGDSVLRLFVQCVKEEFQDNDIFCRWGGDEFLIITTTDIQKCVQKAQHVIDNARIAQFDNEEWGNIRLSFSVGIVDFEPGMTLDQVVRKADDCMYHAKREGLGIYVAQE